MLTTIGLVGCGNWGKNILRDLISQGCQIHVASHEASSRKLALEMGASSACKKSDELPECDGYVVATPIITLATEVMKLLPKGRPIFSEKTLCPTVGVADNLEAAGAAENVFLMHKWEYHTGIQTLRTIYRSGRIGELEQIRCHRHGWVRPGLEPDALTLLSTHDLTIIRHILDLFPQPVFAQIRYENQVPISLLAVLGGLPKCIVSIESRHPVHSREVTLYGSEGAALLPDAYSEHILIRDKNGEEKVKFENNMPLFDELQEFVEYLQGGAKPRCGFSHGRMIAEMLDGLRQIAIKTN